MQNKNAPGLNRRLFLSAAGGLMAAGAAGRAMAQDNSTEFVPAATGPTYRLYPSSVPLSEDLTRRGYTEVIQKVMNPPWRPTASMKERNPDWPDLVPGGAPDNPLGTRALYLGWPAYRIHGTHDTRKIGRRSSNGCVGLYNEHIEELFGLAKVGTQVLLI